jgi:hypothetical protein
LADEESARRYLGITGVCSDGEDCARLCRCLRECRGWENHESERRPFHEISLA